MCTSMVTTVLTKSEDVKSPLWRSSAKFTNGVTAAFECLYILDTDLFEATDLCIDDRVGFQLPQYVIMDGLLRLAGMFFY
ncbi:unnamed protein product [Haemonchus placei]|uniref:Uncharacterized protein n=1 Tax=Haemonchus placei TaxID=6290 RepID=A0A0N4X3E1_HAEPC|nr:unnamed protein product [Haemonchus placei]